MSFEMRSRPIGFIPREIARIVKRHLHSGFNWFLSEDNLKDLIWMLESRNRTCPCKGQGCIHCEDTARYISALTYRG